MLSECLKNAYGLKYEPSSHMEIMTIKTVSEGQDKLCNEYDNVKQNIMWNWGSPQPKLRFMVGEAKKQQQKTYKKSLDYADQCFLFSLLCNRHLKLWNWKIKVKYLRFLKSLGKFISCQKITRDMNFGKFSSVILRY